MIDRGARRISVRAGLEKGSTDFQPGSRQAKCLFYFRHRGPHLTDIIDFYSAIFADPNKHQL